MCNGEDHCASVTQFPLLDLASMLCAACGLHDRGAAPVELTL